MIYTTVESPIGELLLLGERGVLHGLHMQDGLRPTRVRSDWVRRDDAFGDVRAQLREYFAGERTAFDLRLHMDGGAFQRTVWHALTEIPYGGPTWRGQSGQRTARTR
jgi:methylated-DNA-[protein]-cysteine S-methyltransferase